MLCPVNMAAVALQRLAEGFPLESGRPVANDNIRILPGGPAWVDSTVSAGLLHSACPTC